MILQISTRMLTKCKVVADSCFDEDYVALVLLLYIGPWLVLKVILELLCD